MAMRKIPFVGNEYYHIYNRGVDKRDMLLDSYDLDRFMKSMREFNVVRPIGSIYENRDRKRESKASIIQEVSPLVKFVVYGINPNHFHFILEQTEERGIEKFMHRLGTGFSKYFNAKYQRSGSLFQGKFKAIHIDSNEYLLHLSAYINLNDRAHNRGSKASMLCKTSWDEYLGKGSDELCDKNIILGQFKNASGYRKFAEESLEGIIQRKIMLANIDEEIVEARRPQFV